MPETGVPDQSSGRCRALAAHEVEQLLAHLELGADAVLDVGPVEARHEVPGAVEREARGDLAMRGLGGRGGEGDARHVGPALGELGEGEVVGAEVVAPLRDAVRLVDREQGDAAALEEPLGGLGVEPLGCDVEQVELAGQVGALDLGPLGRLLAGVEVGGAHAVAHEGVDLVVHERDEGRHHHARALAQQRGDLVAEALAATGRHEHDGVAAARDLRDDLGLLAAEGVVAEDGVQRLGGRVEARRGGARDAGRGWRGRRAVRVGAAVVDAAAPDRLEERRRPAVVGGRRPVVVGRRRELVWIPGDLVGVVGFGVPAHPSSVTSTPDG